MNTHTDRRANAIAIVSPDALLAALVGAAVELIGYRATFPDTDDSSGDALRRTRATFVLVDCNSVASAGDAFLGRAMMAGARLFLFGSAAAVEEHAALAQRYGMGSIVFPRDFERLDAILTRRISPRGVRSRSLE